MSARIEKVFQTVPLAEIYKQTGLQTAFYNTLYQLCAERVRPEFQKAEMLLFTPDLLNYWLTGKATTEHTIASISQLLDAKKRDWDFELIEKLGLPKKIFGKIVPPGTILGPLTAELQTEIGGNAPVISVGGHDTVSAVAATPRADKHCAYLSYGT